jgi:hypothetical protein
VGRSEVYPDVCGRPNAIKPAFASASNIASPSAMSVPDARSNSSTMVSPSTTARSARSIRPFLKARLGLVGVLRGVERRRFRRLIRSSGSLRSLVPAGSADPLRHQPIPHISTYGHSAAARYAIQNRSERRRNG